MRISSNYSILVDFRDSARLLFACPALMQLISLAPVPFWWLGGRRVPIPQMDLNLDIRLRTTTP
jgi:hypothetical protein